MKKLFIPVALAGCLFFTPNISEAGWLDNVLSRIEQRQKRRELRRERRVRLEKLRDMRQHRNQQRETTNVPELDASTAGVAGAVVFGSVLLFSSRRKKETL